MISRIQNMHGFDTDRLSSPPSTGPSSSQFSNTKNTLDDPGRPKSIDNCSKDEARGDILQPPHQH